MKELTFKIKGMGSETITHLVLNGKCIYGMPIVNSYYFKYYLKKEKIKVKLPIHVYKKIIRIRSNECQSLKERVYMRTFIKTYINKDIYEGLSF